MKLNHGIIRILLLSALYACSSDDPSTELPREDEAFYFGADLSYVNQILDHGGVYKENNVVKDPYQIFKDNGLNLLRVRLWHNPTWTNDPYGDATPLYSDLRDVEKTIRQAKALGLQVLLDFHYSDTWADPSKQFVPAAWEGITSIDKLRDSVYNYTFNTLKYLKDKGLQPELVQIGNETNCGLLFSEAPKGFPTCNVCEEEWANAGEVLNAGIRAVRAVSATSAIKTKVLLHVADPANVAWWFDKIKSQGHVTDFDMIGFSYYPLWHTTVPLEDISIKVSGFKTRYGKDVIMLETDYPWTTADADTYHNQFGDATPLSGFPFTEEGQLDLMVKLTTEVKQGGGIGIIPWEPALITSGMIDSWGTGSSFDNCAYFNFAGNKMKGMDYMKAEY
jgi:arabinogalactan endo-1,4-beta-galactosidase